MTDQMREQETNQARAEEAQGNASPDAAVADRGTDLPPIPDDAIVVVPVRNVVLFPGVVVPLSLGRVRTIAAAQEAARTPAPARRRRAAQSGRRGPGARAALRRRHGRRHHALRHRTRRRPSHRHPGPAALPHAGVSAGLSVPGRAHRAHRGAGDGQPRDRGAPASISRSARSRRCSTCRRRRASSPMPFRRSRRLPPAPIWWRASWTSRSRRSRRSSRRSTSRRGSTRSCRC